MSINTVKWREGLVVKLYKGPSQYEIVDIECDWTNDLATDETLSSAGVSADSGISASSLGVDGLTSTVRLSTQTATAGTQYSVSPYVVTSAGQRFLRPFEVLVVATGVA